MPVFEHPDHRTLLISGPRTGGLFGEAEPHRRIRDPERFLPYLDYDRDVGSHTGHELQVTVVYLNHDIVGYNVLNDDRRLPDLPDSTLERGIGIRVNRELDILAEFKVPKILFHWYDGPTENLDLFKERGYWISIGPAVLYSRRIGEIVRAADLSMVLSETDGPVSYRGLFEDRLTQPSFVVAVVQKIAEIKGSSPESVRDQIFSNFQKFTLAK